ncbi:hypothetical protein [Rhizobium ruizarguesonis]|uniref:hypothetical protein n=1 Tax=Rhizobium ruizarguesonis TaxID=2081791 RepID=UPI00143FB301|nr:hypothetical protein [Rhizobium ruizarguesonis]
MGMIRMVVIAGVGGLWLDVEVVVRVSGVRMAGRDDVWRRVQSWIMRSQCNERI